MHSRPPSFAARFAFQLLWRLMLGRIVVKASRQTDEPQADPFVLVLALVIAPLYLYSVLVWLATGRGPGGQVLQMEAGTARVRPRAQRSGRRPPRQGPDTVARVTA